MRPADPCSSWRRRQSADPPVAAAITDLALDLGAYCASHGSGRPSRRPTWPSRPAGPAPDPLEARLARYMTRPTQRSTALMQRRLTGFRDTPRTCQSTPAILVNLPCISTPSTSPDQASSRSSNPPSRRSSSCRPASSSRRTARDGAPRSGSPRCCRMPSCPTPSARPSCSPPPEPRRDRMCRVTGKPLHIAVDESQAPTAYVSCLLPELLPRCNGVGRFLATVDAIGATRRPRRPLRAAPARPSRTMSPHE
jgi:hypothetical protein